MTAAEVDPADSDTRARRRARLRNEAQDIALEMFAERGYEHVTMAEIAEALDVAERTLFRYFPTKESLLDPAHEELVEQLVSELAGRPPSESAFTAVRESLRALGDELTHDQAAMIARTEIINSHPSLQAHMLRRQGELEDAITSVVANRSGINPETDIRPTLFAATAVCALRVAVDRWVSADTDQDLLSYIEVSLDALAAGLGDL